MTGLLSILWSVTKGAWLTAAAIVLIRLVFHRVLSAKAKYYLWLLLALRLMLPVLPESPLSLMNVLPAPEMQTAVETDISHGAVPGEPVLAEPAETIPADADTWSVPADTGLTVPQSDSPMTAEQSPAVSRDTVLFWVWLGGMGVVLLGYLLLYALTARQLRRLPFCTDSDTLRVFLQLKRACGVKGGVRLVSGGGGMLGGLIHPTIVIPAERHGEDVAPILVHELMHYRYKDLWLFLLMRVLTAVYWFNPVVWLCFRWARNGSEAACDQRVLETNLVRPDCYAGVLYEEGVLHTKKGPWMQTAFGGDRHSLKRRIRGIAAFKSPKLWMTVLAVVLAVAVAVFTITRASSKDDIREAIIGVNMVTDSLASYESDTLGTADLSEEELQAQLDAYQAALQRYYSADAFEQSYIELHTHYLRDYYSDPEQADYTVNKHVISCDVKRLWVTGSTATATGEVVMYSNEILRTVPQDNQDDGPRGFYIRCWAYVTTLPYTLVQEDGLWKVQDIEISGEPWREVWCADIDGNTYDTFEEALEAARSVDLSELEELTKHWNTDIPELLPFPDNLHHQILTETASPEGSVAEIAKADQLPADILEKLASYPSGYRETCKRTDLVVIDQGGSIINQVLWDRFYSRVLAGEAAEVITAQFTMEGDPILNYVWYDGTEFLFVLDSSRDEFGVEPYYQCQTFSYLYPVPDGNTEIYVLADEQFDDLDAYNAYCQTDPEKFPQTIFRKPFQHAATSLETTISPYVLSDGGITYGNTQWGMTVDEIFTAEGLDEEAWRYVEQSGSIMPRETPIPDHPEVSGLFYYFNYTGPELEFGLNLVITRYNAQTVGFDQLVAQRTRELGVPGFQDETKASWAFPDGSALLLINDEDILDERLTASMSQFADGTLQNLDVEAYMEDLQAPNGHFGWTFDRHVEAGLLDPNDGTLESRFEEEDSSESLYFHTTTELGGYEVPITYLFHKTLVSEEPVLTQVFVTPPEGVVYRDWVESFWDPWKDKLYEQSSLHFSSPVMLSSLLPEDTQRALIDQINAQTGRTDATLTNWSLMVCWYEASANFWQFNGTGAALYLTVTEAQ